MRLIELEIINFRQFEGRHVLQIAPDGEQNVTVVYGANGSGKTTLLNAFTWCLYGSLTQDFMYPNRLLSDGIWANLEVGQSCTCSVSLEFEHNEDYYTLTRSADFHKKSRDDEQTSSTRAKLIRRGSNGSLELNNPSDFVDTILPERLHHFFFLNGERFDHLLTAKAFDDIESAIKTILGIEIIERGIHHLKEIERRLNKKYQELGTEEEAQVLKRLEDANSRIEKLEVAQKKNTEECRLQKDEIAVLDQRLRELEGSKRLQVERETLLNRYATAVEQRDSATAARLDMLGERAFLPFMSDAVSKALARYEEMREKREIPRGIKLTFVEDLLSEGECICGTDVKTSGPARDHLEAWKSRAGRPELEESWMQLGTRLREWRTDRVPDLENRMDEYAKQIAAHTKQVGALDQQLSELSRKLRDADEEDIRALENTRRAAEQRLDEMKRESWQWEHDLRAAEKDKSSAEADLRKTKARSAQADVARRRVLAAEEVREALMKMRDLRVSDVRTDLDSRIKDIYKSVVKKRQVPALSESFQLLLQERQGGELSMKAMSTGEAQVLTLSFVGALADLARTSYTDIEQGAPNPLISASGGIFPFVADAIFGTLDENFRREVTRLLPALAPQVVLFLSKAQAAGEVQEQLKPVTGSIAVVDAQMSRTDVVDEVIVLDGREIPYVSVRGGDVDRSVLQMIKGPEGEK